jgi:hypothetical protein
VNGGFLRYYACLIQAPRVDLSRLGKAGAFFKQVPVDISIIRVLLLKRKPNLIVGSLEGGVIDKEVNRPVRGLPAESPSFVLSELPLVLLTPGRERSNGCYDGFRILIRARDGLPHKRLVE